MKTPTGRRGLKCREPGAGGWLWAWGADQRPGRASQGQALPATGALELDSRKLGCLGFHV